MPSAGGCVVVVVVVVFEVVVVVVEVVVDVEVDVDWVVLLVDVTAVVAQPTSVAMMKSMRKTRCFLFN
jgi:hypothetical protein